MVRLVLLRSSPPSIRRRFAAVMAVTMAAHPHVQCDSRGTAPATGKQGQSTVVEGTMRGRQRRAASKWWPTTSAWARDPRKDVGPSKSGIST